MSAKGETVRLVHDIERAVALLQSLLSHVKEDILCTEAAQAVADSATRLVSTAARRDAYMRAGVP